MIASAAASARPSGEPRLVGRTGRRVVVFPTPLLLAPMEGVTDRSFRACVLDLGGVGGACTEFARIAASPIPAHVLRRELGPIRRDAPVAIQIMTSGVEHLAETVANAEAAGAAWIDLNFGCPAPKTCGRGAGSALLDDPELLGSIVAEAVNTTELPVSAKVRVGVRDTSRLEEIVSAAAGGGAAMLTVHGRRRCDAYSDPADWEAIARAADAWRGLATGPFCGNGSVESAADARRMMRETGCDLVMIGRGALADPFVFRAFAGAPEATPAEAARFALDYLDAMQSATTAPLPVGRMKQLVRWYRAGGIFEGREDVRQHLLRSADAGAIRAHFEGVLEC